MATFATRLKDALNMNHMTAADLSKKTGISEGSISQYLKGTVLAKSDKIYAISRVLDVTPEWLMAYDDMEVSELSEEVRIVFNSLPTHLQEQALLYLHYLAQLDTEASKQESPDSQQ